jgi:hypothetical protein
MKIKSDWIEYTFKPIISKLDGKEKIVFTYRGKRYNNTSNWGGIVDEEYVKSLLSNKQFQKWKRGKQITFIKHFTPEERKLFLKRNNQKK